MICPLGELQVPLYVAALTALLARRIEPISRYELDTVPMALVSQLSVKLIKALLLYSFGQVPVLHHAAHIQVLHDDKPWLSAYYLGGNPVYVVMTNVSQSAIYL